MGRTQAATTRLCDIFKDHVIKVGRNAIISCANEERDDPTLYVNTILQIYQEHKLMVDQALDFGILLSKPLYTVSNKNNADKL